MSQLDGGHATLLLREARDARQRLDLPVIPDAEIARADPSLRRHRRCLDDHQRSAADSAAAVMHEMPVRRHAVACRVLAHGRDADAVGQDDVTQLEGFEQMGHGSVPD